MNALLAAGSKCMQSLRKGFSRYYVNSYAIKSKSSLTVYSDFPDEICFPADKLTQKGIGIAENIGFAVFVGESALLITPYEKKGCLKEDQTQEKEIFHWYI